jgi:hypothetical protein
MQNYQSFEEQPPSNPLSDDGLLSLPPPESPGYELSALPVSAAQSELPDERPPLIYPPELLPLEKSRISPMIKYQPLLVRSDMPLTADVERKIFYHYRIREFLDEKDDEPDTVFVAATAPGP